MTRVLPFVLPATVGSFTRRLGMIFHNETEGKAPKFFQRPTSDAVEELSKDDEELTSTDPLLPPQPFQNLDHLADDAEIPPVQSEADLSPFILVEQPQVEIELQTEADMSLEEAEEAKESPLHNRLSMSLITCHEGTTSSRIFAQVHCDGDSSPDPGVKAEEVVDGVDPSNARASISMDTEVPNESLLPSDAEVASAEDEQSVEVEQSASPEDSNHLHEEKPVPPIVCSPEKPKLSTHIRCPTFDPRSPSQVVFKPQWLGKGFGANGLRVKSVHGQCGKGGSSPLAVHVAVKNATNENKGQSGKQKQKGACMVYTRNYLTG